MKKILSFVLLSAVVLAGCKKNQPAYDNETAYQQFAQSIEEIEKQWTMVYNVTVNNEENAEMYGENPAYLEIVDNAAFALSGVQQNIETKKTWAEESYQAGTLGNDLDEILGSLEELQIQLTQVLNVYNDAVKALGQDAAYEELAMAIESLEQQWTMVYNATVNNADDAALYGEMPEYQEIVANASTALSAVQQNLAAKKTWIEESYQAGTLAEDAEEIYSTFEEIQIQLTQTLNVYNAAVAELGGSELDAIYDELVAAWDQLDAQWYMVYNVTVNNSEDAAKAKAKGKEGIYEEIVFQASVNLTAVRTTLQEKLALMDYSYEDGTLLDKAEEIYMSFETDIQIPLTQIQMTYNQQFAELIGE